MPKQNDQCSYEEVMLRTSRRIASLEAKRRTLRRELRDVADEIRLRRRELKAAVQMCADRSPASPPMRLFNEH